MIVARIAMRDVAADRALVAHLGIGNEPRALDQQRALTCRSFDQISSFSVVIAPMRIVPPSSRIPLSSAILPRSIRWPVARSAISSSATGCGHPRAASPRRPIGEQASASGKDGRVILKVPRDHRSLLRYACSTQIFPQRTATRQACPSPGGRRISAATCYALPPAPGRAARGASRYAARVAARLPSCRDR